MITHFVLAPNDTFITPKDEGLVKDGEGGKARYVVPGVAGTRVRVAILWYASLWYASL